MKLKTTEYIYRIYNVDTDDYIGSYKNNHWINRASAIKAMKLIVKNHNKAWKDKLNIELHTFKVSLDSREKENEI